MSKLMVFVHSGAEDILNFDRFGPLKSCGVRIHVSHAYTLRKKSTNDMGFKQVIARGANINSLGANEERVFKIVTFRTYQKTVKLTVSQLGNVRKMQVSVRNLNVYRVPGTESNREKTFGLG
jgi:hypothetical protein